MGTERDTVKTQQAMKKRAEMDAIAAEPAHR